MQEARVLRGSQRATAREICRAKRAKIVTWLEGRSEFFTTISGFKVTRLQALGTGTGFTLLAAAALLAEALPLVSIVCLAGLGVIVRLSNREKGGRR